MSPGATVVTVLSEGQQLSKYIFSVYNNSNFSPDMWLVGWQNASGLQGNLLTGLPCCEPVLAGE